MKRKWQMKAKKKQIIGKNDNGHRRKGNSDKNFNYKYYICLVFPGLFVLLITPI